MDTKWSEGIWLGHNRGSNESSKGVMKAWAVRRRAPAERWSNEHISNNEGSPHDFKEGVGEEDGEVVAELSIVTFQSLEEIIDPQTDLTLLRTFQIMSWQLEDMHIIRVRLNLLDVDPEALYKDIWQRLNGDGPVYGEW